MSAPIQRPSAVPQEPQEPPAPPDASLRARYGRLRADRQEAWAAARRQPWLVGYALACTGLAAGLAAYTGDWRTWLVFYLGLVGLGSLGLAFFAWRGTRDPAAQALAAAGGGPIRHPARETGLVLLCILAFAAARTAQLLGFPPLLALFALNPDPTWPDTVMVGIKLLLNVLLPLAIFLALGYRLRALGWRWGAGWRLWPLFLLIGAPKVLGALLAPGGAGPGLLGLAGSFVYYFFAAGLPEEFTARALLQTRLEAWTHSPTLALIAQAAVFTLVHIPIRLLGGFDPLFILGNLALFVFTLGLLLGYLYRQTAALGPVAAFHALINA